MYYRLSLMLFIIIWPTGQTVLAQTPERYRVELLVLRNLQGVSDLSPQTTLRDFSNALDLLAPLPAAPADDTDAGTQTAMEADASAAIDSAAQPAPELAPEAAEPEPEPEPPPEIPVAPAVRTVTLADLYWSQGEHSTARRIVGEILRNDPANLRAQAWLEARSGGDLVEAELLGFLETMAKEYGYDLS